METDNEVLKEETEKLLCKKPIKTFKDGWYTDEAREVFHSITAQGISCRKVQPLLHKVLDMLVNEEMERLPKKSLTATMPIEAHLSSKMQVGAMIQCEPKSTLNVDGTAKKCSEFSILTITTGATAKPLSLGFVQHSWHTVDDYMDSTWNIFHEIWRLLLPKDDSEGTIQGKCAHLFVCLKNLQTDRHVVNKSYFKQLTEFRCSLLPAILEDYDNMSLEQLTNIVWMNHTFCGLHAIHNLGSIAKETLKEFKSLGVIPPNTSGFHIAEARICTLLWELSKAFTRAHNYQKAGAVHNFEPYLNAIGEKNHFVSLHGERITVLFVQGVAAYYHRNNVKWLSRGMFNTTKQVALLSQ